MKNKCDILKKSFVIMIITFFFGLALMLIRVIFNISSINIINYFYDLSISLFGCSLLIFFLSIKDYWNAKDENMKDFFNEAYTINNKLKNINYIFMDIPHTLITKYILEVDEYKDKEDTKRDNYQKLYNYIYEYYKDDNIDKLKGDNLKDYINRIIDDEKNKLIKDLDRELPNYLELNNVSLSRLNFIVGDTLFFNGENTKEDMYSYIYQPLYDIINEIKNLNMDIGSYKLNDSVSLELVLNDIKKIQDKLFIETYDGDNIHISYGLTNKVDKALESWRALIYKDSEKSVDNINLMTLTYKTGEDKIRHIIEENNEKIEKETKDSEEDIEKQD